MQSLSWYRHRLRAMSIPEMAWRVRNRLRESIDRRLALRRMRPPDLGRILDPAGERRFDSRVVWQDAPAPGTDSSFSDTWRDSLVKQATRILDHRLHLFGDGDVDLGEHIDWNRDYRAGVQAPLAFSAGIDYRDFSKVGDAKWVWELNRHHHLVVLARAYRATGDRRFAEAVAEQIDDWIEQCPFGYGMNWRSPLELAIRLINWVWAVELIRPSGLPSKNGEERLLVAAHRHLWEVSRKYSRYSSANNHLIGEAAGVYIGSSYFCGLRESRRWRDRSRKILSREIIRQTFPEGASRELATGYHLFVLQFFTLAGLSARRTGEEFCQAYWQRLERMYEFAGALTEGGGHTPMFGDSDDGYVLDLGGPRGDIRPWLSTGAVLFNRPDLKETAGGFQEATWWLTGRASRGRFEAIDEPQTSRLQSKAFPDSGIYLLQSGSKKGADQISLSFDCGPLGFESIAAHGHADALAITLRAYGEDVLVDPGTYDYFSYRTARDYFRSTQAHNTVVVDNLDQSEMLGPFLWGDRATARCTQWADSPDRTVVAGEHDGYRRLPDPVTHRRTIVADWPAGEIRLRDEIIANDKHHVVLHFHFGEKCEVTPINDRRFRVAFGRGYMEVGLDAQMSVLMHRGSSKPMLGWISRGYHRKTEITTLTAACEIDGEASFETVLRLNASPAAAARESQEASLTAG